MKARIEVVPVSSAGQRRASNIVKAGSAGVSGVSGVSGLTSSDQFRVPGQQSVILSYSRQHHGEA